MIIDIQKLIPILILIFFAATTAHSETPLTDVGNAFPAEIIDNPDEGIPELDAMMDVSFLYTDLRGEGMGPAYGGLPHLGLGFSMGLSDKARFFASLHYGRTKGDPYYDVEGIDGEDSLVLESIPLMVGMKANLSDRKSFRLYLGAAFQYAFVSEEVPTANSAGTPTTIKASGTTTGYYLSFGPEFLLGDGSRAIGAEIAVGGSKGELRQDSHHHDVDLTGIQARVYYTFGL